METNFEGEHNSYHQFELKIQSLVKESIGGRRISVYYPGIGGGEEAIDIVSPFTWLDADDIVGSDIFSFSGKKGIFPFRKHVLNKRFSEQADFKLALKKLTDSSAQRKQVLSHLKVEENNLSWRASFILNSRPRNIEILKTSQDATIELPNRPFNVIYSKRTIGVVDKLPTKAYDRTDVIFFIGEGLYEVEQIRQRGINLGFYTINLNPYKSVGVSNLYLPPMVLMTKSH